MKTLLVDDEKLAIKRLKSLLTNYPNIKIIDSADNGKDAIKKINDLKPDLVFMDIEMPEYDGFQVLKNLSINPIVVFVTAYNKYAIKAFEANGVDYLLKPVSQKRMDETIKKVSRYNKGISSELIMKLKKELTSGNVIKRFAVESKNGYLIVPEKNIYYFNSEDKYIFINTYDKKYFYDSTLKKIEKKVDNDIFLRVHRSYIVSLNKIEKVHKWFGGRFKIILNDKNKTKLTVSRSRVPEFKKKIGI